MDDRDTEAGAEKDAGVDHSLPPVAPDFIEQNSPDASDDMFPTRGYQEVPMVALGGSAGSITPLTEFFKTVPPDTGMAFVVILHLSPDYDSTLAQLLGRVTSMPVTQAEHGQKVSPNCVYVIPPGKHLLTVGGHLSLTELEPERGRRIAVDLFFRSLADTHGPNAIAIVLSGADSDGSIGIKRIKERGGLTIVQDPDEAECPSMPKSAIETGMVDWILAVKEIPSRLVQFLDNGRNLKLPPEGGSEPAVVTESSSLKNDQAEAALREVLIFLRTRTGRDFSYYKRATIVRRIARRMLVNNIDDLPAYLSFLRLHPGEATALLQDLLISVTNFFRDRDVFDALEGYLGELFQNKSPEDTVRVWVPACATGEEAYSIAMMLVEHARTLQNPPALQVFGCDLDERAIQVARAGLYSEAITADVSQERLRKFFVKDHKGYRVKRELREMILFAAHDLLKDPPFSRMDLISCRNLLIYLKAEAQKTVFETFHFALRPNGLLLLGSSESVNESTPYFKVIDKKSRIYRHGWEARFPSPSLPNSYLRSLETSDESKHAGPVVHGKRFEQDAILNTPSRAETSLVKTSLGELHYKLIERFGPPSILVNRDYEIMHLSKLAGEFLRFSGGEPTNNLLRLIHPNLRVELRTLLFRATESDSTEEATELTAQIGGEKRSVQIRVSPSSDIAPGYLLITFESRKISEEVDLDNLGTNTSPTRSEHAITHLERELEQVKENLRDTVEQYEASTEELKASNEELQAMNEELRSATEELETSREELQSVNEELTTVNQEMKRKVDELAGANSDLQNLMAATAIPTVFLNRDLAITRFTPSAAQIFNLIPGDIGRPLAHLKPQLEYPDLMTDVAQVLRDLTPIEREVKNGDRWYLARIQPYRTTEDHIAGTVLTFVDITDLTKTSEALRQSEERMRLLIESAKDYAIFTTDTEGTVVEWYGGAETVFGYTANEMGGRSAEILYTAEDRADGYDRKELEQAKVEGTAPDVRWHMRKDGRRVFIDGRTSALRDGEGRVTGFLKIGQDVTERRHFEAALHESEEKYRALFSEMDEAYSVVEVLADDAGRWSDFRFLEVNRAFMEHTAMPYPVGRTGTELLGTLNPRWAEVYGRVAETGEPVRFEEQEPALDRVFDLNVFRLGGTGSRRVAVLFTDITERKRAEAELRASEERFRTVLNSMAEGFALLDPNFIILDVNDETARLDGRRRDELIGRSHWEAFPETEHSPFGELYRRVMATREVGSLEHRYTWPDGRDMWVDVRAYPTHDGNIALFWQDVTIRKQFEEALQEREQRYRTLFDSIDEGFAIQELTFGNDGEIEDIIFREVNEAYERQGGVTNVIGKSIREVLPNVEQHWMDAFAHVARTREPLRIINYSQDVNRWFDAYFTMLSGSNDHLAVVFNDITERKHAEERQLFLLQLSDSLRAEPDPESIKDKAVKMLAKHLSLDRCWIAEVSEEQGIANVNWEHVRPDLPPMTGIFRLADLPETMRQLAMQTIVVQDLANDSRFLGAEKALHEELHLRALLSVPLRKGERQVIWAMAAAMATPRQWTEGERMLLEDVAERTWAAVERAKAEASLRETQESLHIAVEAAEMGTWDLDLTKDLLCRRSLRHDQIFGYKDLQPEWGRDIVRKHVLEEDQEIIDGAFARACETGELKFEVRLRWPDGTIHWMACYGRLFFDQRGKPVRGAGVNFDITDRKRAEEGLRESEEKFRILADTAPALIWFNDAQGENRFINQQFVDFTGMTAEEIRGVGWHTLVEPDRRDAYVAGYMAAARDRRAWRDQARLRRYDGQWRWFENYAQPLFSADGTYLGHVGVTIDITEAKRAEEVLRESEARLQTAISIETVGVLFFGIDGRIESVNDTLVRMVGYTREELLGGLDWHMLTPPEFLEVTEIATRELADKGETSPYEKEWIRKDGSRFWGLCAPTRVSGEGKESQCVEFVVDITDRKLAEAALRENQKRQAFFLKLSDTLRPITNREEIKLTASRLLGEELGANRVFYADAVEGHWVVKNGYENGVPPLPNKPVPMSDYGGWVVQDFKDRKRLIVNNMVVDDRFEEPEREAHLALQISAKIALPLIKGSELIAMMVAHSVTPREWTEREVTLLEEAAERVWAALERARIETALRASEERFRRFGEASHDVLWIRDSETLQWQYLTPAFERIYGLSREEALTGNNYENWLELVVEEDKEVAAENIRKAQAGEHVRFDYRIRRPSDGMVRWLRNTDFPILDENGVTLIGGIGHDLTELRETEIRLQTLIEGIPQLVWRAGEGGSWTWASKQWTEYTGQSEEESLGWGWLEMLHPDDRAVAKEAWANATGIEAFDVECRIREAAKHRFQWFQTRATPVRNQSGQVIEWLGTSTDINELRELQERQEVLVGELQHRTRNLMAVVRSMAQKTARASRDLSDFQERFRDRLEALARVQGLLSRLNEHDRVTFDELIATEFAALGGAAERVTLSGPAGIRLRSSTVQTLAMAIHELATNAVKYGALHHSSGHLDVTWSLEPHGGGGHPWLHIEWRETGVPMGHQEPKPERGGHGRDLIERALPYQLQAQTRYELRHDGVYCTISIPVSKTTDVRGS